MMRCVCRGGGGACGVGGLGPSQPDGAGHILHGLLLTLFAGLPFTAVLLSQHAQLWGREEEGGGGGEVWHR